MANIILPQVSILDEINDSTKLMVEQDGQINRYPIADLELGGGDVTIDLSSDNIGEATGVNADTLGGYAANQYAKLTDINNMLEIDLYGATAAEPNLVDADTLGGFDANHFASVEEMDRKLSIELLWENASPTSSFSAQTVQLSKELDADDWVIVCFKAATNSDAVANIVVKNGTIGRVTSSNTTAHGFRNATVTNTSVNFSGAIWGGDSNSEYLVPTHIYRLRG